MTGFRKVLRFTKSAGLLGLLMLLPMMAKAQGWAIQGQAVDSHGKPLSFALVRVCPYTASGLPCSPLTSLWSDIPQAHSISNPYTTDATGNYSFVVNPGQSYLVQVSATGTIYSYLYTAGTTGSGSGTVTNFSAGNLSPLFTTSVSNPTTTPSLSFALSTTADATFYANFSGGTAAPQFWTLAAGSNVTLTPNTGTHTLTVAATGGGGGNCPSSAVPANSVLYSPSGTNCTGDGNFSYFPGSNGFVILNNNQDGSITNLLIEAQHDNTGGVGTNETNMDGQNISVFFDGGGTTIDRGMLGVDVEANDLNFPGSIAENLTGYQSILDPEIADRNANGYESAFRFAFVSPGTVEGFQVDAVANTKAANFYGYRAKLLGNEATGDDAAFFAGDRPQAQIVSGFCDFLSYSSDPVQRLSLGCGQDAHSNFYGPVNVNDGSGHAGYASLGGGTSPTVNANTAGILGPNTGTFTAYALQLPATGPTTSLPILSCPTPSAGISACTFVAAGGSGGSGCSGTTVNGACYNAAGTGTYSADVLIDQSGGPALQVNGTLTPTTIESNGTTCDVVWKNSAGTTVKIELFACSGITDYSNGSTVGSAEWAINQLGTNGGALLVHPGIYPTAATILVDWDWITIDGTQLPYWSCCGAAWPTHATPGTPGGAQFVSSGAYPTFTIGNTTANMHGDTRHKGIEIRRIYGYGAYIAGTSFIGDVTPTQNDDWVILEDNTLQGYMACAITEQWDTHRIIHNTIQNNGGDSICEAGGFYGLISQNIIYDNGGQGLTLSGGTNTIVTDNQFGDLTSAATLSGGGGTFIGNAFGTFSGTPFTNSGGTWLTFGPTLGTGAKNSLTNPTSQGSFFLNSGADTSGTYSTVAFPMFDNGPAATFMNPITAYAPNAVATDTISLGVGQTGSTNNQAYVGLYYAGSGSTSNYGNLSLNGSNALLTWWPSGSVGVGYDHTTGAPPSLFSVNGAFQASSAKLTGITGSTQCLQANSSGVISGTGSNCATGTSNLVFRSPYLYDGTNFYVPSDGYQVTIPSATPTWLNSNAPSTVAVGTYGNIALTATANSTYWASQTATTSIEGVMRSMSLQLSTNAQASEAGIWVWDSTNNKIYSLANNMASQATTGAISAQITPQIWTYSGSGSPTFSSNIQFNGTQLYGFSEYVHYRLLKSGTSLLFQQSLDGGSTFFTIFTQTGVGTISSGGYFIAMGGTATLYTDVISLKAN